MARTGLIVASKSEVKSYTQGYRVLRFFSPSLEEAAVVIIVISVAGAALRHFYDVLSCVTFIGS